MTISPARLAAYRVLLRVQTEDSYANELLNSQICAGLSPADRGLAMQIAMGALRWQSMLDDAIASFAPGKLDAEVRVALRMAAYQIGFLDRVPARAAIFESVELVKAAKKRSAAAMVNAVLRKLAAEPRLVRPRPAVTDDSASIARAYSHPEWMVRRWLQLFGEGLTKRICDFDQQPPPVTIRIGEGVDVGQVENDLRSAGTSLEPCLLLSRARTVTKGDILRTNAFVNGEIALQDEVSQLVALLVGHGARILDCCAAPGSKTRLIAERNPAARITAVELHPHRARLLLQLVPAANVTIVEGDITAPALDAGFDRVLADVPCSGTGTLARNPEIKWRLTPGDIADLAARQLRILSAALARLAPSGRLVYSTCSLEREENESVVASALAGREAFRIVPVSGELERLRASGDLLWPETGSLCSADFLRTLPGVHPGDGFFAAIIERIA